MTTPDSAQKNVYQDFGELHAILFVLSTARKISVKDKMVAVQVAKKVIGEMFVIKRAKVIVLEVNANKKADCALLDVKGTGQEIDVTVSNFVIILPQTEIRGVKIMSVDCLYEIKTP